MKFLNLVKPLVATLALLSTVNVSAATLNENSIIPPVYKTDAKVNYNQNKEENVLIKEIAPFTYTNIAQFKLNEGDVLEISNVNIANNQYISFGVTDEAMSYYSNIADFYSNNSNFEKGLSKKFVAMKSGNYEIWIGNKDDTVNKDISCKINVISNTNLQNNKQILDFIKTVPSKLLDSEDRIQFYKNITASIDKYLLSDIPVKYDKENVVISKLVPLEDINMYIKDNNNINYTHFISYNSNVNFLDLVVFKDPLEHFYNNGSYTLLFGASGKDNTNTDLVRAFIITVDKNMLDDQFILKNLNDIVKVNRRIQNAFIRGTESMKPLILTKEKAEEELKKEFNITNLNGINIEIKDKVGVPYLY